MERWVGPENLVKNIHVPIPGKAGIILWDDYISVLSPDLHTEFCAPCNKRLYKKYGQGHLHTCGPYFPGYINAALACEPRSMDTSIMRGFGKTREDLINFRKITQEKNILLFGKIMINDISIFEKGGQEADDELLTMFIKGGCMPASDGTYEKGVKFREFIDRVDGER